MSFPRYEAYKDSGVEWLGEVPEHWKILKGSYIGRLFGSEAVSEDMVTEYGRLPFLKVGSLSSDNLIIQKWEYFIDKSIEKNYEPMRNFIVFPKRGAAIFLNKVNVVEMDALLDPNLMGWEINSDNNIYYFAHLLKCRELKELADISTVPQINNKHIAPEKFPSPPPAEQTQIAHFLDHETARIDALIAEQERLIELLKEKRQAVISHAVTKGLDRTAPMKDSGVEWLGEVPKHWTLSFLKDYVSTVNGFGFSSSDFQEEGVPFIRAGNIKNRSITDPQIFLPNEVVQQYKRVILDGGDIVICMVGSDPKIVESAVGQVGIVPDSLAGAVPNQNVVILRENNTLLKSFLFYSLLSNAYRHHLNVFSHKLANQSIISSSLLVSAKFACPNLENQQKIVDYLDQVIPKIETLVTEAEDGIVLLQERRSALISAAVTGKIDIRGWKAPANTSPVATLEAAYG